MSYEDNSFSLAGRAHGSNISHDTTYGYHSGYVITPYGIVGVYAQGSDRDDEYSSLSFALNGRQHSRTYRKRRLTLRGMVTASTRFAREITEAA